MRFKIGLINQYEQFLTVCIECVRIHHIPKRGKNYADISKLDRYRNLIDQAKDYQLWRASLLSGEAPISSDRFEPRKSYAGILFCIGGRDTTGGPCASIEFYSVLDDRWFRGVDMTTRRRHVAACSVAGELLIYLSSI